MEPASTPPASTVHRRPQLVVPDPKRDDSLMADLLDRLDSAADLALEALHRLEWHANDARKEGDLLATHRLDAVAALYRQRYLSLCALRGARLRESRVIRLAGERLVAAMTSLTAEIQNLEHKLPALDRLASIAADLDSVLGMVLPLAEPA